MAMTAVKAKKEKAMKAMKAGKAMNVSKIARGRGAKTWVFSGKKEKTSGGFKKVDFFKNKSGKVVSKKASIKEH